MKEEPFPVVFYDEEQRGAKSNTSHLPDSTKIELDYARRKPTQNPILFSPDPKKAPFLRTTHVDPTKPNAAEIAASSHKQPLPSKRNSAISSLEACEDIPIGQ